MASQVAAECTHTNLQTVMEVLGVAHGAGAAKPSRVTKRRSAQIKVSQGPLPSFETNGERGRRRGRGRLSGSTPTTREKGVRGSEEE